MRCDPSGEIWATVGKMAVGAAVGMASYALGQAIAGEPIDATALAISAGEGAVSAISGTVVGAAVSGAASLIKSACAGSDMKTALVDAAVSVGSSLVGSGCSYIGGRVKLTQFKNTATKGELKSLGRSLKKTKRNGNEFKQLSNWNREMNHLGSKYFKNSAYARYCGYLGGSCISITYRVSRCGR